MDHPAAASDPPPLRRIRANGVELAYVEEGSGDPVVFVHGACGDWRTFDVLRPAAEPVNVNETARC